MATHSPLAPSGAALDTNVSEGPGPASEGPGAGPSLISPACQDAKLENLEGLPAGRLRTARQSPTVPANGRGAKVAAHYESTDAGRIAWPVMRNWPGRNRLPSSSVKQHVRPVSASRQGFDQFYSSSAARLVRHGYALTGDMAEAQDIAQEAFARAWQRWSVVRDCDSPEAWVRRVATNLAASRWRRIRVARAAAGNPAEPHAPEVSTDTVALVSGLRTLPERQRTVLVLHYLCDLTVDQIAAELGCPAGSVKSWLSRGRTALAAAVRIVEPEPERAERAQQRLSRPARPQPEASHA
jgi:RNA polymerase sigma-70 factor, ECF subfamily